MNSTDRERLQAVLDDAELEIRDGLTITIYSNGGFYAWDMLKGKEIVNGEDGYNSFHEAAEDAEIQLDKHVRDRVRYREEYEMGGYGP